MTELLAFAAAPLLLAVVIVLVREPLRLTLPIYAALIPFGGRLSIGSSPFGSLSSLVGILLGIGLLLRLATVRQGASRLSPTVPIWLLFLAFAGITMLWTFDPSATFSGVLVLASLVLVYALIALSDVDRSVLVRTENGLLAGGVLAVCYGLVQLFFLGGFPADTPGSSPADDGRFGNDLLGPNNEAVALLIPLVIALSRSATLPTRGQRSMHATMAGLLLGGIVMTGSRSGALATAVAVVVLIFTVPSGRRVLLGLSTLGIALVLPVVILHPDSVASRNVEATSSSGRTDIWKVGLAACPHYCGVGAGWGSFPAVYADTQASVPGAQVLVGKGGSYQAHNVWLLVAIELGLPGLLLLGIAIVLAFIEAVQLPARLRAPPLSALVGTLISAMFLSYLEFKFFWMAFILIAMSSTVAHKERGDTAAAAAQPLQPQAV